MSGYGFSTPTTTGYDAEDRLVSYNRTDGNLDQSWSLSEVGDWDSVITEGTVQNPHVRAEPRVAFRRRFQGVHGCEGKHHADSLRSAAELVSLQQYADEVHRNIAVIVMVGLAGGPAVHRVEARRSSLRPRRWKRRRRKSR